MIKTTYKFVGAISIVLIILVGLDYWRKKQEFEKLKNEYQLSKNFASTQKIINRYFYENGWYPSSLEELDTLFSIKLEKTTLSDLHNKPIRFFIDPFSQRFFKYIPVINQANNKAEGYYLLSAGIDSRFNTSEETKELNLYDSISFNYLDFYFGEKDLLFGEGSIGQVVRQWRGRDYSLSQLFAQYDSTSRRELPRVVKFSGIISSSESDYIEVRDRASNILAKCYWTPILEKPRVSVNDEITIKGIYKKLEVRPDTTFIFLNCSVN